MLEAQAGLYKFDARIYKVKYSIYTKKMTRRLNIRKFIYFSLLIIFIMVRMDLFPGRPRTFTGTEYVGGPQPPRVSGKEKAANRAMR